MLIHLLFEDKLSNIKSTFKYHCYHVDDDDVVCCVILIYIFSGNDNLHDLTSQAKYTLRIDLGDFENATRYAVYSNFAVAAEGDKYRLSFRAYSGTAGDYTRGDCSINKSMYSFIYTTYPINTQHARTL